MWPITVLHVTLRCTYFVYTPVHDAQIHGFNPWFVCMGMNALHKCRRESETFSNAQFHERPQGRFYMLKSTVVHVQSAHIKVVCRGGIAWSLCGHCGATSAVYSSPIHHHPIFNIADHRDGDNLWVSQRLPSLNISIAVMPAIPSHTMHSLMSAMSST